MSTENQKNRIKTEANALRKVYAIFRLAYEFKLRVTIAASGQGRFGEELQFAEDCANSGAIPILVVLDPTPNPRLRDLQAKYESKGGHAYIGEDAWAHLEEEAGDIMATFIEKYVRKPVTEISSFEVAVKGNAGKKCLRLLDLNARILDGDILLKIGNHERLITRQEDSSLVDDDKEQDVE